MNTLKSLTIAVMLLMAFSFSTSAQKYSEIKIKTSAQSELCKTNIENAIAYERGVKDCDLDMKTKVLTVKYKTKKTSPKNLRIAITKIGYDADGMHADPKAYSKLPKECKKPVRKSHRGCGHSCGSKCGTH